MPKRHPENKTLPTPPTTYRRLFRETGGDVNVGGLLVFLAGMYVHFVPHDPAPYIHVLTMSFSEYELFDGFVILLGVYMVVSTLFGTLRSVIIDGEKLICAYRLNKNVYQVSDVKAVGWQTFITPRKSAATSYDTYLVIEMGNRKKVKIPGSRYSRPDIEKIVMEWRERYVPSGLSSAPQHNNDQARQ